MALFQSLAKPASEGDMGKHNGEEDRERGDHSSKRYVTGEKPSKYGGVDDRPSKEAGYDAE